MLRLNELLKEWNVTLSDKQLGQFDDYYKLLIEWNKVMNLTAIIDKEEVIRKHFLDSLAIVQIFGDECPKSMIDIGTGAGFPGIPLKIFYPDIQLTLLDSLQKRIKFINEVILKCELYDIQAVHGRAEEFGHKKDYREKYDVCVSRAVANLSTLSEYCLPFVIVNGYFISYKAVKVIDEKEMYGKSIEVFGGRIENTVSFELPQSIENRSLVVIKKEKKTPLVYARNVGIPAKKPIVIK